jgi:hypothetical protein
MRRWAAIPVLVGGLALSACGGSSGSSSRTRHLPTVPPVVALGCAQYCQQAGVAQGENPPGAERGIVIAGGSSIARTDGLVPVTVTCHASSGCTGALVVVLSNADTAALALPTPVPASEAKLSEGQAGQADLSVPAGGTRRLGVPLADRVVRLLRRRGELSVTVLAETGPDHAVSAQTRVAVILDG